MTEQDRLIPIAEAAYLLGLTEEAFRSRVKRGQIPYVRLPGGWSMRYKLSSIKALMQDEVPATETFGRRVVVPMRGAK